MSNRGLSYETASHLNAAIGRGRRAQTKCECAKARLRQALADAKAELRQKDNVIRKQDMLARESNHRLLNGLQLIASLLALQSRTSGNAEVASQLAIAANRVAMIGQIHRRLQSLGGVQNVDFKQHLEDICLDFATILSSQRPARLLDLAAVEAGIPANTAMPLAFIVSELLTNSVKYGKGNVAVRLERDPGHGYALSVSDHGPGLPAGVTAATNKGLGLKLIVSLAKEVGGELRVDHGDDGKGSRFAVLFPSRTEGPATVQPRRFHS